MSEQMAAEPKISLAKTVRSTEHCLADGVKKSRRVLDQLVVSSETIQSSNFDALSVADLRQLFSLIDDEFFGGLIGKFIEHRNYPVQFRVSRRMTNSGGITTTHYSPNGKHPLEFEIAISSTLLFESFRDEKPLLVTGLLCGDRLQALKRIMEHEMVHLIEMLLWNNSSCSALRFQNIARRFFGHKQSTHQLITPTDTAESKYDISFGDWVSFHLHNKPLYGFVNRITKRATVLVPSSSGTRYTDGKCYKKYYVPIDQLRKAA